MTPSPSFLFVCLGNICRSPLAEAAFREEARRAGLELGIDSAGTGDWHVGQAPDPRAQAEAARHGVDISGYRARQVRVRDFREFTHILALDSQNLADLRLIRPPDSQASLSLLLDYQDGRAGCSVADPYYGGPDDFARTWQEVTEAAASIVRSIRA